MFNRAHHFLKWQLLFQGEQYFMLLWPWITQIGENINCFYSGPYCSGNYSACLDPTTNNCKFPWFNYVSNSDSKGNFHLRYGVTACIRDFAIVLNATSNTHKLPYNAHASFTLEIIDVDILTSIPIWVQLHVITNCGTEKNSAPI